MGNDGIFTLPQPAQPGAIYNVPVPNIDNTTTLGNNNPGLTQTNHNDPRGFTILPGCTFTGCTINLNMMAQSK